MGRLGRSLLVLVAGGAAAWAALAFVLPRAVGLNGWAERLASRASGFLGSPVWLGPARLSLWTGPALRVHGARVGQPAAAEATGGVSVEASELTLRPSLLALLGGRLELRSVSVGGLRLAASGVPLIVDGCGRLRLGSDRGGPALEGKGRGRVAAFESGPEGALEFSGRLGADGIVIEDARVRIGPAEVGLSGTVEQLRGGGPAGQLETRARFGSTSAEGRVGFRSVGGRPEFEFELRSGFVDLDQMLRKLTSGAAQPPRAKSGAFAESRAAEAGAPSSRPAVLSLPSAVVASGTVDVALARVAGLSFGGVKSRVGLGRGRLALEELTFEAYGGHGRGRLVVDLAAAGAPFELKAEVEGADVRALSAAAGGGATWLEGDGSIGLSVRGDGLFPERLRVREGAGRIAVRHGRLQNVGLFGEVFSALDLVSGRAAARAETPFEALSAGFEIGRGMASTRDLVFRSEELTLDGRGAIGLDGSLALEAVAKLSPEITAEVIARVPALRFRVGRDGRLDIPLRIGGAMGSPTVRLDLDRVFEEGLRTARREPRERILLEKLLRKEER